MRRLLLRSVSYAVLSKYLLACETGCMQVILLQKHECEGNEADCTTAIRALVIYAQRTQTARLNHSSANLISSGRYKQRTSNDLALVSMGSSHVSTAAIAQQRAKVPSATCGCPFSTRSTVRKGDSRAPTLEHALHTPRPKDRTCVG